MEDSVLNKQIKNFITINSFLSGSKWITEASCELDCYGIKLSPGSIKKIRDDIASGKREAAFPTVMGQQFGRRHGKDQMYTALFRLCDIKLKNIKYCGLPALNTEVIAQRFGRENITVCERDSVICKWLSDFYERIFPEEVKPELIEEDIFQFLEKTEKKFNLFDLDLMISIRSEEDISQIVKTVCRTSEDKSVISLATVIGRKNSYKLYESVMPHSLLNFFEKGGWKTEIYRGKYQDRVYPVKYEHIYLEKKNEEEHTQ